MDVIRSVLGAEEEKKHISHGSHQNVTAAKELSVVSKTNLFIIVLLSRASEERGSLRSPFVFRRPECDVMKPGVYI